jgi:hypothetical protein
MLLSVPTPQKAMGTDLKEQRTPPTLEMSESRAKSTTEPIEDLSNALLGFPTDKEEYPPKMNCFIPII